jgi:CHASE3 domain sensor protein
MRTQRLFLGFSFATLALISAASIALDAKSQSDADWVAHTLEVTNKLLNLRLPIRVAESAQGGYLLTGEDRFLNDYRRAIALIVPAFAELAAATADNPAQQDLLAALKPSRRRSPQRTRAAVLYGLLRQASPSAALSMTFALLPVA